MQNVTHLFACAAKTDIFKRLFKIVRQHPVGKYALVNLTKLPWPGNHSTAIHNRLNPVCGDMMTFYMSKLGKQEIQDSDKLLE